MEQEEKKTEVKTEIPEGEERPTTPATQSSPAAGQSKKKSKRECWLKFWEGVGADGDWAFFSGDQKAYMNWFCGFFLWPLLGQKCLICQLVTGFGQVLKALVLNIKY